MFPEIVATQRNRRRYSPLSTTLKFHQSLPYKCSQHSILNTETDKNLIVKWFVDFSVPPNQCKLSAEKYRTVVADLSSTSVWRLFGSSIHFTERNRWSANHHQLYYRFTIKWCNFCPVLPVLDQYYWEEEKIGLKRFFFLHSLTCLWKFHIWKYWLCKAEIKS